MRILALLFFVFCISCSNSPKGEPDLLKKIMKSESGIFRGIDLGQNPEEIKTAEKTGLTEEHEDYLFYEFPVDSSNSYTISYSFEENQLNEIKADIYVASDTLAKKLCDEFIEYFSEKYNTPIIENASVWTWPTIFNNLPTRIELADESADYSHAGKLSLVIYKEPDMAM